MSRHRSWTFTLNNYTEDDIARIELIECKYCVFGREIAPETGTPHLQGYISFDNPRHLGGVKALFGNDGVHLEGARGTAQQNREYCIKDGDFTERGDIPLDAAAGGSRERERWARARQAAAEGRFGDIDDDLYVRYQSSFKRIRKEDQPSPNDLPQTEKYGKWFYGPPRTGKSHRARTEFAPVYLKDLNKWWDGYDGELNCLIDEIAPEHSGYMVSFLKRWADRWKFGAETKGGRMVIRPALILVTSNYSIDQVFASASDVDRDAIKSRFEEIEMNEPYNL